MNKLTDENIQEIYESAAQVGASDDGNMWDFAVLTDEITNDNPCMMIVQFIDRLRDAERRLQVPVKIPDIDAFDYNPDGYLYKSRYISALEIAIKTAGFKVEE
jgi:hypothetical protein